MRKLIINMINRSKRLAICSDDKLEQVIFINEEKESIVGNIYIGTIERVLAGMNAAFVNIGLEHNGYLPLQKMASFNQLNAEEKKHPQVLSSCAFVGKKVLVQIEADATKTKGPKVTELYEINKDDLVFIYQGNYGAVSKKITDKPLNTMLRKWSDSMRGTHGALIRTSAAQKDLEQLTIQWQEALEESNDLQLLLKNKKNGLIKQANSVIDIIEKVIEQEKIEEIIVDDLEVKKQIKHSSILHMNQENIFSYYKLEEQLAKSLKRVVWLENGAYLIIDEVEALTIIDVNTGGFSGKNSMKDTAVKTNKWALKESFNQIQLRNLSGMILIDFIEMPDVYRKELEEEAIRLATTDSKRLRVVGFTNLGILQLTRKKTTASMLEQTTIICPTCNGQARVTSADEMANRLERELFEYRTSDYDEIVVVCSEDVHYNLTKKDEQWYNDFLQVIKKKLQFEIKLSAKPFYEIRKFL